MANFVGQGPTVFPHPTTEVSTTEVVPLGTTGVDGIGNEYTFVKAGAAIALNDAVRFAGSVAGWDDVRPTSALAQVVVGAARNAIGSGSFGWIQTNGVAIVKVVVSTAAGSSLVSSATAGTLQLAAATDIAYRPAVALVTGVAAGSEVALL